MASTYSTNLKIELIGTGDQSGTWGTTTNTNLGTLLEQAIVGHTTQAVADSASPTTLTIPDGASSTGRNYVIELTGALTANRTVEVPAVDKPYIIHNNTSGGFSVTVKVSGQTGVTVANGKKALVYADSTDVRDFVNAPVSESGTQTLTNKTISVDNNTVSGVAASSFVLSNASGNIDGAAAQKVIPSGVVVGTTDSQTLTNKTLTSPVISTISNTGTLTLPTTTDTLVGRATTDTLTNKTLTSPTVSGGTISSAAVTGGTIDNTAIGGTTPAAGVFTTLSSTGNTTLGDASADTVTINGTVQPGVVISGSSAGDALRITQTGAGNALVVEDNTNPDSTPFVIDASGNLNLGTTTSTAKLTIYDATGATFNLSGDASTAIVSTRHSTDATGVNTTMRKTRGTFAAPTAVASGDTAGNLNFNAYGGSLYRAIATINGVVETYTSDTNISGRLVFNTNTGSTGVTEKARLHPSGGFSVGNTTDPGAGYISDVVGNVRDLPQNSQTGAYVLVASDNGKHISITTGGVTVPASVFAVGDTVTIFNNSGSSQTITQGGSVTLRQVGTANTGNRTLAQYGLCTILCVATDTFVITGGGLS